MQADFDQCAHDIPHHMMQKAVAAEDELVGIGLRCGGPCASVQRAKRRFALALGVAEAGKIGIYPQRNMADGVLDGGVVKGCDHMPHKPARMGRHDPRIQQCVGVPPARGAVAGVEGVFDPCHPRDPQGGGQEVVEAIAVFDSGQGARGLDMAHLRRGVHPGIGAACGDDGGGIDRDSAPELAQGFGQRTLHTGLGGRPLPGLKLPAAKGAAVVLQGEFQPGHGAEITHLIYIDNRLCNYANAPAFVCLDGLSQAQSLRGGEVGQRGVFGHLQGVGEGAEVGGGVVLDLRGKTGNGVLQR